MVIQTVGPLPVREGEGIVRAYGNIRVTWSSARGVSCMVKSSNERNPHRMLNNSCGTGSIYSTRKAGMTSSQHGSYALGHKHPTMANNNELLAGNGKLISEISPQF